MFLVFDSSRKRIHLNNNMHAIIFFFSGFIAATEHSRSKAELGIDGDSKKLRQLESNYDSLQADHLDLLSKFEKLSKKYKNLENQFQSSNTKAESSVVKKLEQKNLALEKQLAGNTHLLMKNDTFFKNVSMPTHIFDSSNF